MIDIKSLMNYDLFKWVEYRPKGHPQDREVGVISSWNDEYIFVRFDVWDFQSFCSTPAKSVKPEDLSFVESKKTVEKMMMAFIRTTNQYLRHQCAKETSILRRELEHRGSEVSQEAAGIIMAQFAEIAKNIGDQNEFIDRHLKKIDNES